MKITPYTASHSGKTEYHIMHKDGVKELRVCCYVDHKNNTMWHFIHIRNGASKYFDSWEQGLEHFEAKGW